MEERLPAEVMKIHITCFAGLAPCPLPNGGFHEFPEGARVEQIIAGLGIPEGSVRLVFVNGVCAALDAVVREGDRVGLFPAVGGG